MTRKSQQSEVLLDAKNKEIEDLTRKSQESEVLLDAKNKEIEDLTQSFKVEASNQE